MCWKHHLKISNCSLDKNGRLFKNNKFTGIILREFLGESTSKNNGWVLKYTRENIQYFWVGDSDWAIKSFLKAVIK